MNTEEMTYSESAAGQMITPDRARRELAAHGLGKVTDWQDFLIEVGNFESYDAGDVLTWLGY